MLGDNRAVTQGKDDGGDLNVDLLHGAPHSLKKRGKPAKLSGRDIRERPSFPVSKSVLELGLVARSTCAAFNAAPQLSKHRPADAENMAGLFALPGTGIN